MWLRNTVFSILLALPLQAANHYVRKAASGTGDGSDWVNAFTDLPGSLIRGDTYYVGNGTYNSYTFTTAASGTTYITIKKAIVSDHGTSTGWSDTYAAQAVFGPMAHNVAAGGGYIDINGQTTYGFKFDFSEGQSGFDFIRGGTGIKLQYIDMDGVTDTGDHNYMATTRAITDLPWSGTAYDSVSGVLVSHCALHGGETLVQTANAPSWTFEYCDWYDNRSIASAFHSNVFFAQGADNLTLRYNRIHNFNVEGFYFPYGNSTVQIYGNVFYAGASSVARGIELRQGASFSGFSIFNNTFANIPLTAVNVLGSVSSSSASNNIFWVTPSGNSPNEDYEFSDGNVTGVHSITGGSNPFVNLAGADFHLVSTIGAKYPRNKGAALAATYNTDPDGIVRGADGTWDMGAYEYPTAGGSAPVITSSLTSTGTNGIAYSYSITASGGPTSFGASPLPTGLSVSGSSGIISGTPNVGSPPTTNNITITATNAFGFDSKTLVLIVNAPTATIGIIATNTLFEIYTNGMQDRVFVVTNTAGAGTLTGDASTASPWSIVGNTHYSLTTGNSTNITMRFSPTVVGVSSNAVAFTGGGGATNSVLGWAYPVAATNFAFPMTNGLVFGLFTTNSGYVYQGTETLSPPDGGRYTSGFQIAVSNTVTLTMNVNAADSGSDSFWINIDAEPTDPTMIWDVIPDTTGFQDRTVGWRGNGAFNAPQFPTNTWSLAAGYHKIIVRGREANAQGKFLTVVPAVSSTTPNAPTSFSVVSGNASNVLSWVTPSSDGGAVIGGYYISRSTVAGNETYFATVTGAGTLGYTNTGLNNGTTYFYTVAATNANGVGTPSAEASGTPSTIPDAPTGLIVSPGFGVLFLNWQAAPSDGGSPNIGYKVYRGLSAGTETQYAGLLASASYSDTNVSLGTTYFYKVSEVNANGEGSLSSEANGTPSSILASVVLQGNVQLQGKVILK